MNKKQNLVSLCESAIMIALAVILSFLKLKLWANGGSIDLVMVPLIILGWRRGAKWSVPACFAFGFLKCLISGGIGWGLPSVLLDYVLAYGAVGIAGFFRNKKSGLFTGTLVASVARFAVHFISGVTIYRIAVGESAVIFGSAFTSSFIYSAVYNGSYMLVNCIVALIAVAILQKPISQISE